MIQRPLVSAIKSVDKKSLLNNNEVLRILTTRSKSHLKAVCEQYKKLTNKNLDKVIITFSKSHYVCIYTPCTTSKNNFNGHLYNM